MSAKANASEAWFKKADGDLFAAKAIQNESSSSSPHWDMVLFHAHQSIEKHLKGLLAARMQSIPKTHDLPSLVQSCSQFMPQLLGLEPDCDLVNRLYLSSRYPGMKDVSQQDAERGIQVALAIKETVLRSVQK
jgi:HEPN domain-containing protein